MRDKWMSNLKNLSESYKKKAPDGLLNSIKRKMSDRGIVPASGYKKYRINILVDKRLITIAAMIAIVAGVAFYFSLNNIDNIILTKFRAVIKEEKVIQKIYNKHNEETESPEHKVLSNDARMIIGKQELAKNEGRKTEQKEDTVKKVERAEEKNIDVNTITEAKENIEISKKNKEEDKKPVIIDSKPSINEYMAQMPAKDYYTQRTDEDSWALGAFYSGAVNGTINSPGISDYPMAGYSNLPGDGFTLLSTEVHAKHKQPVKIGMSVRYYINDRWSIQTGITYSHLVSDFYEVTTDFLTDETTKTVTNQKLNYLGIPISAGYYIFRNKYINVYTTAGGEIEQRVSGTVSEHRPVLSANIDAGIEFQAHNLISIYAEPGVSYYFKNGSEVESAYTDKRFNFNINIGLRLNLNN